MNREALLPERAELSSVVEHWHPLGAAPVVVMLPGSAGAGEMNIKLIAAMEATSATNRVRFLIILILDGW